jgi:hypothetical protein
MKFPFVLSLAAALLAAPAATLAQTAMPGQSTEQMQPTMATYVCRTAMPQDQTTNADAVKAKNAVTGTLGNETVVCMKLDHDAMMAASAKAKQMRSAAEADAYWTRYVQSQLNIPMITL